MPSAAKFEISDLLKPISAENPAGSDLRLDPSPFSIYRTLRDARETARKAEKANLDSADEGEKKSANWAPILTDAPRVLATLSKDFQVACWLIEASIRDRGFQGLEQGLAVLRGLLTDYFDSAFPAADEDGLAGRLSSIAGLNGEDGRGSLIYPLGTIPLTDGRVKGPFGYASYLQVNELKNLADPAAREARIRRGYVTPEDYAAAIDGSSDEFLSSLRSSIEASLNQWNAIAAILAEKCGREAPATSDIKELLENCLRAVPARSQASAAATPDAAAPAAATVGAAPRTAGAALTREQAFADLTRIAAYFKNTEPHSPISYGLEQIVRWGRLPLPQLLMELIPEESPRVSLFKLVGIHEPPKQESQ